MISISVDTRALDKLLANLQSKIETFDDMSKRLSEMLAKAFVARARKRLIAFTGDKRYSYYIKAIKNGDNRWSVIIRKPKYDPYIMYFFEYGTGFVGQQSEQNPDKPADWLFTINKGEYWYDTVTIGGSEKEGWYFNYKPNHFVQEDDVIFEKTTNQVVFTSGIKPVMYLYKTKQEINTLLKSVFRNGRLRITYKQLKSRLNALISGDVA